MDGKLIREQIINHIQTTLASNPSECFILQGYSQGASATVNALPSLTDAESTAVKGVFLVGDPEHRSGYTCNFDNNGGTTTRFVNGLEVGTTAGIPSNWISKSLDVCIFVSLSCYLSPLATWVNPSLSSMRNLADFLSLG